MSTLWHVLLFSAHRVFLS